MGKANGNGNGGMLAVGRSRRWTLPRLAVVAVVVVTMVGLGWGPVAASAGPTETSIEDVSDRLLNDSVSRAVLEILVDWNKVEGAYNMAGLMFDATQIKAALRAAIARRMPNASEGDIELELKKAWDDLVEDLTRPDEYSMGKLLSNGEAPKLFEDLGFPSDRELLLVAAVNEKGGEHAEQRMWHRLLRHLQGTAGNPRLGHGSRGRKSSIVVLQGAKVGGYSSRAYCLAQCRILLLGDRFPEQNKLFLKNSRFAASYLLKIQKTASANQVQAAEGLALAKLRVLIVDQRTEILQEAVENQTASHAEAKELARLQDQLAASRRLGLGQQPCPPSALGPAGGALAAAADPCSDGDLGGLIRALAAAGRGDDYGGVDFSTLQLRYVSARPRSDGGLPYAYAAQPLAAGFQADEKLGANVIRTAREDLRTWLALDPKKFWVNLSPDEPDRIVDDQLGTTNAGRVLLEADLQLKRSSSRLSDPRTKTGAALWKGLKHGSSDQLCLSTRLWIVPKPAVVYEKDDALYVLEAPLEVRMEADYLGGAGAKNCPRSDPATEAYNHALEKAYILPSLNAVVNAAPEYAALRRTYVTRVVAEWLRRMHIAGKKTAFDKMIDSGDVRDSRLRDGWRPRKVFDAFVHSYRDGDFTVTQTRHEGDSIVTHRYFLGGVDLSQLSLQRLSGEQMNQGHGGTVPAVQKSITEPVTLADGSIWLGGTGFGEPVSPIGRARDWIESTTGDPGRALWAVLFVAGFYVIVVRLGRRPATSLHPSAPTKES